MSANHSPEGTVPSWQDLEEIGAGDGLPTECERCGKPGTPRQQFTHNGRDRLRRRACCRAGVRRKLALSQSETFSGRARGGRH